MDTIESFGIVCINRYIASEKLGMILRVNTDIT